VHRVFEAIFRHPLRLILLLVLLPSLGAAVAYLIVPRTYSVTATLWALKRFEVIGATGTESNLLATEATTQATALDELLQTRAFDIAVGSQANLASTLDPKVASDPTMRDDAIVAEVSKHVTVTPQSTYLFSITYANTHPQTAQKVVAAVINNYSSQSTELTVFEGQRQLDSYNAQLSQALKDQADAVNAEAQYLRAHPELATNPGQLPNDPQYAQLHLATQQAQSTVQSLQDKIAGLQQQIGSVGSGPDTLFKVIDAPRVPDRADSRTKELALAGGVGLAVALLACVLIVVVSVRRDRALYNALDVATLTPVPVIMQIPRLSGRNQKASGRPVVGGDLALPSISSQRDAAQ
jgi:hypothetical protein